MLTLYQTYLASELSQSELLLLKILVNLLQIHKWVRLESLANRLPLPIAFESRRKKLQRFLALEVLNLEKIWFPLLKEIVKICYNEKETLYLVPDRTRWGNINIFMVSLIYQKRAIQVYFKLLKKKGNSSATQQIEVLSQVFPLFKSHQKVVLGDREFGNVELAKWLKQQEQTHFVLRVKKNEYFENQGEVQRTLVFIN